MKPTIIALAVPLLGLGLLSPAIAGEHSPAYLSLGYAQHDSEAKLFGDRDLETGDVVAKLGGQVSSWFAVETRLGATVSDDEQDLAGYPGLETEYSIDYFYGGYLKFGVPSGLPVTPYVLGGYTEGQARLENRYGDRTDMFYDVSYGAGVDLDVSEKLGVNLEYMVYNDEGDTSLKGPSASVYWKF